MNHPDAALFLWMSAGASPPATVLAVARAFAEGGPSLCLAIMAWAAWRQPRERGYLAALLAMAGLASLLSHGIANAIGLQRPFVLGLGPAYITHRGSAALPSTHAAVMGLVALGLALRPRLRRWFPATAACALLTGWARIYVGVHFPSDILAGFFLSALLVLAFLGIQWLTWQRIVPAILRIQQPAGAGPPTRRPGAGEDQSS